MTTDYADDTDFPVAALDEICVIRVIRGHKAVPSIFGTSSYASTFSPFSPTRLKCTCPTRRPSVWVMVTS